MSLDIFILKEFQAESKQLIETLLGILEKCEDDFSQVKSLEQYGQTVDRIMGAAQSLAIQESDTHHLIHKIGDYAAICKAVGYKASQINDNANFYNICVALLLDATEMLAEMVDNVTLQAHLELKALLKQTFLDRLRWVSSQFGAEYRATVDVKAGRGSEKLNQEDIDHLLKKLGLD